mgnify:CR=1 FL=1
MRNVYVYVLDTMADWELGHVSSELHSGLASHRLPGYGGHQHGGDSRPLNAGDRRRL